MDLFIDPGLVDGLVKGCFACELNGVIPGLLQRWRSLRSKNPIIKLPVNVTLGAPNRQSDPGVLACVRVRAGSAPDRWVARTVQGHRQAHDSQFVAERLVGLPQMAMHDAAMMAGIIKETHHSVGRGRAANPRHVAEVE